MKFFSFRPDNQKVLFRVRLDFVFLTKMMSSTVFTFVVELVLRGEHF